MLRNLLVGAYRQALLRTRLLLMIIKKRANSALAVRTRVQTQEQAPFHSVELLNSTDSAYRESGARQHQKLLNPEQQRLVLQLRLRASTGRIIMGSMNASNGVLFIVALFAKERTQGRATICKPMFLLQIKRLNWSFNQFFRGSCGHVNKSTRAVRVALCRRYYFVYSW